MLGFMDVQSLARCTTASFRSRSARCFQRPVQTSQGHLLPLASTASPKMTLPWLLLCPTVSLQSSSQRPLALYLYSQYGAVRLERPHRILSYLPQTKFHMSPSQPFTYHPPPDAHRDHRRPVAKLPARGPSPCGPMGADKVASTNTTSLQLACGVPKTCSYLCIVNDAHDASRNPWTLLGSMLPLPRVYRSIHRSQNQASPRSHNDLSTVKRVYNRDLQIYWQLLVSPSSPILIHKAAA